MPAVPGLRSAYATVGRLVYFGRMLDKLRLHAAGALPADYVTNLGDESAPNLLDARCCRFLGVRHADLRAQTLARPTADAATDLALLRWAETTGGKTRTDEDYEIWNTFMLKRGWRDAVSPMIAQRLAEWAAPAAHATEAQTLFDLFDLDEGRDPILSRVHYGHAPALIVVTGVLGAGKTTLGRALASALRWKFLDADDFHPAANRAKLTAGQPLHDQDRAPWLATLRAELERRVANPATPAAAPTPCVLACSALRAAHREILRVAPPARQRFLYLRITPTLAAERAQHRQGHFASPALLADQFATLAPPSPAEAIPLDAALPASSLLLEARLRLGL